MLLYLQPLSPEKETRAKMYVLGKADIVCSTLNNCGAMQFLRLLGPQQNEKRLQCHFTCVIIDEVNKPVR